MNKVGAFRVKQRGGVTNILPLFAAYFHHRDLRRVVERRRVRDGRAGAGLCVPGEILRDRDEFRDS
jgi:hypothetical protein